MQQVTKNPWTGIGSFQLLFFACSSAFWEKCISAICSVEFRVFVMSHAPP